MKLTTLEVAELPRGQLEQRRTEILERLAAAKAGIKTRNRAARKAAAENALAIRRELMPIDDRINDEKMLAKLTPEEREARLARRAATITRLERGEF